MMKTSSFFTYEGPGRISIARYAPRKTPAGYRIYRRLAPGPWFNRVSDEEYRTLFDAEILAPLDPQATWDALHSLALGAEPVLLCWERPFDLAAGTAHCHRRIVADWFQRTLGHEVPEVGVKQKLRELN